MGFQISDFGFLISDCAVGQMMEIENLKS